MKPVHPASRYKHWDRSVGKGKNPLILHTQTIQAILYVTIYVMTICCQNKN